MNLAKNNPTFAFKFGFIQNTSQAAAAINESTPAHATANEPNPVHTTANEPTPTHSKEGVVGGGGGGKREGVHVDQEDTRPVYEQLDILGNQEEKQTGGTERGMNRVIVILVKFGQSKTFIYPPDRKCMPRNLMYTCILYTVSLHCQY